MPNVLDMFCGAGGMAEGFIQAGFSIPVASDIHYQSEETYVNRHTQLGYPVKFIREDINNLIKDGKILKIIGNVTVDVVCGGPPCQGFSIAGKRDANDPRNKLVHSYIELLSLVKPDYFVMENVEGILSSRIPNYVGIDKQVYENCLVTELLISECSKFNYIIEYKVLDAAMFGVPQHRKRVFFIGHRAKRDFNGNLCSAVKRPAFPVSLESPEITVSEAIGDLASLVSGERITFYNKEVQSAYQRNSREGRTPCANGGTLRLAQLHNHEASRHNNKTIKRFSMINEGETICNLKHQIKNLPEYSYLDTNKMNCKKLDRSKASPTVLTLPDDLIHYEKNRILSVRELARLQSFDDSFIFLGKRTTGGELRKLDLPQYTQVGNAVPPLLAKAVANEIMKALKNKGSECNDKE